ncbi:DUF676-domain-containing protein [Hesseltinella vesiculosa]|uniref:DUF676-domain-containing protein n=1 Tax=Hesseltinella vesiculosa TaxID=101127 RepID=A0A1X2G500_9FUNG|nr:DUF676-domain-containing protein [Hesseltinella vesiculosa]
MDITLIVLQHGLWGKASHMDTMVYYLNKEFKDDNVQVLNSDVNEGKYTYDGIDVCGIRLANKIESFVKEAEDRGDKVTRLGVVGYSLGGLICRYAMGVLDQRQFFNTVEPLLFMTFATPHLGVRRLGTTLFSKTFNFVSGILVSRSGEQLQLVDQYKDDQPLLSVLASPDYPFFHALKKFKILRTYANVSHDRTVPHWTAAMLDNQLFKHLDQLDLQTDDKYPSIVTGISVVKDKKRKPVGPGRFLLYMILPLLFPIVALVGLIGMTIQGLISRRRVARLFSRHEKHQLSTAEKKKKHRRNSALLSSLVLDAVDLSLEPGTSVHHTHLHHDPLSDTATASGAWTNVIPSAPVLKLAPPMEYDVWTKQIQTHLNLLPWQVIFVQLDVMNAHGGIICRQRIHTSSLGRKTLHHFVDSLDFLHQRQ